MLVKSFKESIENNLVSFVLLVVFLGCMTLTIVFEMRFNFRYWWPMEKWIDFFTYFNNAISPVLLLASVMLLYQTWLGSREALKVQKRELEETKNVLKEQTDTQNFGVFKDALFEVTDSVALMLETKVLLKRTENEKQLFIEKSWGYNVNQESLRDDERIMTFRSFLRHYFEVMIGKPLEEDSHTASFKRLLIPGETFPYIEKVKTIALLFHKQKLNVHFDTLEIIIFHRLDKFTWLMFVEIAFYLFKKSKEDEKNSAELVFEAIAGLTCRQLKEISWIQALSDEVLFELQKRKLI